MSSSCKGSDDTVFGGRGGTGIVADIEVGVCRFSVDGCGFVGVYEDVHVRKRWTSCEGYSMVYCRSSVREFRYLRNPSACDLSRKSPIPSSTKCL